MIGFCSWSLRPGGPVELASAAGGLGLTAVQLSLKPMRLRPWGIGWPPRLTRRVLDDAGLELRSGMLGLPGERTGSPDEFARTSGLRAPAAWPVVRRHLERFVRVAVDFELPLISFHPGRVDEGNSFLDRLGDVARYFARHGIALALETGSESSQTLHRALRALCEPNLGVNYDAANFVLFGTEDPLDALDVLAPYVRQVHVKDAVPPPQPGTWGAEVALGEGVVDWPALLPRLLELPQGVDLMLEREYGDQPVEDLRAAHEWLLAAGAR